MSAKKAQSQEISIVALQRSELTVRIIGTTPMIQNRMPAKVMQGLLVGTRKKTRAERLELKHDPLLEYLHAAEIMPDGGPTALGLKVTAVKGAMADAALETPGVFKTAVHRLLFMPGDRVPLYGIPKLRMDVVRSADANKTPDVRSRPCLEQWGAEINMNFVTPQLSASAILTLLHNAGLVIGVGDGRQAKGKLNCGLFRVVTGDDEEWDYLQANCGHDAQKAALENPECYDQDTADLLAFWHEEYNRRTSQVMIEAPTAKPKRAKSNGGEARTNA